MINYGIFSIVKVSILKRVNPTLKQNMWKQFSLQANYKWLDIPGDIVNKYNNTLHNAIRMKLKDVRKRDEKLILTNCFRFETY